MNIYDGAYRVTMSRFQKFQNDDFRYNTFNGKNGQLPIIPVSKQQLTLSPSAIDQMKDSMAAHKCGEMHSNVAGKKKQCKMVGLTGAEKRACAKEIKSKCGRKPSGFLGIKGAAKRAKQDKWLKCVNNVAVGDTGIEDAQKELDSLKSTERASGMSTAMKVGIGAGAVLLAAAAITLAAVAGSKAKKVQLSQAKIA